MRLLNNDNHFA